MLTSALFIFHGVYFASSTPSGAPSLSTGKAKTLTTRSTTRTRDRTRTKLYVRCFMAEFEIEFDAVYLSCLVGTAGAGGRVEGNLKLNAANFGKT